MVAEVTNSEVPYMTGWVEQTIENWRDLQDILDPIAGPCMFRGQANRSWPLVTSFGRILDRIPKEELRKVDRMMFEAEAIRLERSAILRFRSEAHLHLNQSLLPPDHFKLLQADSYIEWLMLMQHYGAPTRLLDWTQSPYVALYFAVIDDSDSDAAIWYFDPAPLTEAFHKRYSKEPYSSKEFDMADLPASELEKTEGDPILYTLVKKMRTAREIAQQGVFTLANRVLADHEAAIANTCYGCRFGKIVLPRNLKRDFIRILEEMNVTGASLFPGVEGICGSIRDSMRLQVSLISDQLKTIPHPPIE